MSQASRAPQGSDPWAGLRELALDSYVILDTETTGLLNPEVVSIAVIDRFGTPLLHEMVRPAKPIEPEASRVTGLTMESVANRTDFPAIELLVSRTISDRRVVIYNAAYDTQVLRNTYARYGLAMPEFRSWCAMEWFARLYGEWNPLREAYVWQSLAKAAAYFGVAQESAHDALGDCVTTWRILEEAFRRSGLRVHGMQSLF